MIAHSADFQMWATFAVIVGALVLYAVERAPMELTSLGVICALLLLFHVFPLTDAQGRNVMGPVAVLHGFASPALITVLALLVMGEGLARTGALDQAAQAVFQVAGRHWLAIPLVLLVVLGISAFLNNTPVVVIFIPIMQALADRLGRQASELMIPLSFAAILGGMTTLMGSSTNLLVSAELVEIGEGAFTFFEFTVPGLVMAAAGMVYLVAVTPRLLPKNAPPGERQGDGGGRQFIAQITVSGDSKLVGTAPVAGLFTSLPAMTVRVIQRGRQALLPPFEDVVIQTNDVLVVAATRNALTDVLKSDPNLLLGAAGESIGQQSGAGERVLAEVMITPASRLIGQSLEQSQFHETHHCAVLGVRRRTHMLRSPVTKIHLEAGDVLLVQGHADDIAALRDDPDVLLMEWSATDLPAVHRARRAAIIFVATALAAASGLVPIVIAAICGAAVMIAAGVLTARHAAHALDRRIVMMIAAALALGTALQETGGAMFLADHLIQALGGASAPVVLSAFFLLVAMLTNVMSNNACAVLFTPIAAGLAHGLDVDPRIFAIAVVFAANCSFATPIGYQTNIMVMTPGQYRFVDFTRVGAPMVVVLWLAFSLFAPWYYGLW